ncbi:hypothetical protein O181_099150, partial [Austropuccinia psidii MF-1]|nr:hypothetical protein [Austropuccinia psidii MF-1]
CFIIMIIETDSKFDLNFGEGSAAEKTAKIRNQKDRQEKATLLVKEATALLERTGLNVKVACQVIHARNTKHIMVDCIDFLEPNLVVVGSRGLTSSKGNLMGSVSHYLVQKSSVPVMVAWRRLRTLPKALQIQMIRIKIKRDIIDSSAPSLSSNTPFTHHSHDLENHSSVKSNQPPKPSSHFSSNKPPYHHHLSSNLSQISINHDSLPNLKIFEPLTLPTNKHPSSHFAKVFRTSQSSASSCEDNNHFKHPDNVCPVNNHISHAVSLEPIDNQVAGHHSIFRFSRRAVCKPLVSCENTFYEAVERDHQELLAFVPQYLGVLNVTYQRTNTSKLLETYPHFSQSPGSSKRPRRQIFCRKHGRKQHGSVEDNEIPKVTISHNRHILPDSSLWNRIDGSKFNSHFNSLDPSHHITLDQTTVEAEDKVSPSQHVSLSTQSAFIPREKEGQASPITPFSTPTGSPKNPSPLDDSQPNTIHGQGSTRVHRKLCEQVLREVFSSPKLGSHDQLLKPTWRNGCRTSRAINSVDLSFRRTMSNSEMNKEKHSQDQLCLKDSDENLEEAMNLPPNISVPQLIRKESSIERTIEDLSFESLSPTELVDNLEFTSLVSKHSPEPQQVVSLNIGQDMLDITFRWEYGDNADKWLSSNGNTLE